MPTKSLTIALAVILAAAAGMATTVAPMNLDELTQRSDSIVLASVKEISYGMNEKAGYPETRTTFSVEEVLFGDALEQISVCLVGGPAGSGKVTVVPGMPRFRAKERAILFLVRDKERGVAIPTGLEQGVFRIKTDPETKKEYIVNQSVNLGITDLPSSSKESLTKRKAETLTFSDFRGVVKEKVSKRKTEKE